MKKIKLSVAALLIAGSGYCSGNDTTSVRDNTKQIIVSCEDMIEEVNTDVENDKLSQEVAEMYIQNLLDIMSKAEDLNYNINTK